MEINASYRTCIVGKVAIYYDVRVMLTEIKMFKTQVDLYVSCRQVVSLQRLTSCQQSATV